MPPWDVTGGRRFCSSLKEGEVRLKALDALRLRLVVSHRLRSSKLSLSSESVSSCSEDAEEGDALDEDDGDLGTVASAASDSDEVEAAEDETEEDDEHEIGSKRSQGASRAEERRGSSLRYLSIS